MEASERKHLSKWVPKDPRKVTMLLIATGVINSATLGYDSSMMNGLNILPAYTEYFHLNTATTGLNNAGMWMGEIFAVFFMKWLADYYGRKKAVVITCFICAVGVIIQSAAQNTAMFVIGRMIVGAGALLSGGAAPVLVSECLPPARRGAVLGLFFSSFYIGSLLAAGVNYGTQYIDSTWCWRVSSIIQMVPSILGIMVLPFVPESPRWLTANGRLEEAKEALAIFYSPEEVQVREREIELAITGEQSLRKSNAFMELFSTKANRHRSFILATFGVITELLGNFVISYYLTDMLNQAGITNTTTQLKINVILSCWCLIVSIIGSFMLDIIGRRIQTMGSIMCCIVMLYIFGGLAKKYSEGSSNTSGIYGSIAAIFLFQGAYSFAITPMTSLYPTEIFPYKLRTAGIALSKFTDVGSGLMASFAMSYAMSDLGWKFYMINASWNFIFLAIVYFTYVETKGLELEDIASKFGDLEIILAEGEHIMDSETVEESKVVTKTE
ncbi:putative hexose transporter [Phaeomoniella chlamydospora]|uniref:Putative hexose transporter n=1 Tax=Phaeomoniella chlamydospora TaxID=158046 RepID=A0A0G2EG76_PHACM|nr:putative hexose transporter [Phaeomoniella chlamydospora]